MSEQATPPVKLRESVLAVPAYRQGAAPTKPGFKLSSNENPFDTLPEVVAAIAARAEDSNRYAAAAMTELRGLLAAEWSVSPDHVHFGAGSVTILFQLVQAAAGPGDEYLHAWPSFEAYPSLGLASGATAIGVPLTERSEHDLDAMADAITDRTRAILLCTPNNPTGPIIRRGDFDRFMARVPADVLVILDEAYAEFVTDPEAVRGADVIGAHKNLVVLRTFSKAYGLAGLRIGYGIGEPSIIAAAASVGIPLSVTGIAESAAIASLAPAARATNDDRIAALAARRDELATALRDLGLQIPAAQGNFVWIPESGAGVPSAQALAADFSEAGTLVRPFPGHGVRISIGEPESLPEVLRIIRAHLATIAR
ncbi:histidinol-phosphate aminotransferase [Leucobacter exalbidus]|uniref:Histidinol-phosphate aminotransferase n=1 Tax=Leucobacter exalbidus TaxID=662960 RepID=A0A940PYL6_9MICO|nr:histidinol-phosphate transaminase [Leucobacter exalbidus]MBP1326531.1 histidinol-phosphate aminotransferase [Leucobacter exalbidus]